MFAKRRVHGATGTQPEGSTDASVNDARLTKRRSAISDDACAVKPIKPE
jgi:hypothetical protein